MTHPSTPPAAGDDPAELDSARALLERTIAFLSDCLADPESARAGEDPAELIAGLRALAAKQAAA